MKEACGRLEAYSTLPTYLSFRPLAVDRVNDLEVQAFPFVIDTVIVLQGFEQSITTISWALEPCSLLYGSFSIPSTLSSISRGFVPIVGGSQRETVLRRA